jgi:hypothetical protein
MLLRESVIIECVDDENPITTGVEKSENRADPFRKRSLSTISQMFILI